MNSVADLSRQSEQHAADDGRARAAGTGYQRKTLRNADFQRVEPVHVVDRLDSHRMLAPFGPQDDERTEDEGRRHRRRVEQVRLQHLADQQPDHGDRQEGDRHVGQQAARFRLGRQAAEGGRDPGTDIPRRRPGWRRTGSRSRTACRARRGNRAACRRGSDGRCWRSAEIRSAPRPRPSRRPSKESRHPHCAPACKGRDDSRATRCRSGTAGRQALAGLTAEQTTTNINDRLVIIEEYVPDSVQSPPRKPAAGPPSRRRRKEARPHELLDAALALFGEKGFAATRTEEVAARAGVSKGTLVSVLPQQGRIAEGGDPGKPRPADCRGRRVARRF